MDNEREELGVSVSGPPPGGGEGNGSAASAPPEGTEAAAPGTSTPAGAPPWDVTAPIPPPAIPGWEIPGPTVVVGPGDPYDPPTVSSQRRTDDGGAGATARTRRWARPWLVGAVAGAIAGGALGAVTALLLDDSGPSAGTNTVREVSPGPALSGGASIPAIVQKVAPQVVSIDATGSGTGGTFEDQGTGMILTTDGQVLTNNHVIANASSITVTLYGKTVALGATVVGADPTHDLALLKIVAPPAGLQPVIFGDSTQLQVGDAVIAIGNALGLSAGTPTVTSGIVSALGRTVQAGDVGGGQVENLSNMIQTDAAINSGNSGGALVDSVGQVIGMNTAVASSSADNAPAENIGFAIPSSTIEGLLPTLRQGGAVVMHRAYLGVEVEDLTPQLKQAYDFVPSTGAVVVRVVSASPAAAAGIEQGDVIVAFDGKTVDSAAALTTAVGAAKPGDKVTVTLWRGQQKLTVKATLGSTAGD
ncbi:MAG TPA: trypsin-like peptidase domain-containing protein [Acidimicrobiales bacterium]|nr:trypsin-like peptidase domain-containing protein [Acidimicrobiales bacterium]